MSSAFISFDPAGLPDPQYYWTQGVSETSVGPGTPYMGGTTDASQASTANWFYKLWDVKASGRIKLVTNANNAVDEGPLVPWSVNDGWNPADPPVRISGDAPDFTNGSAVWEISSYETVVDTGVSASLATSQEPDAVYTEVNIQARIRVQIVADIYSGKIFDAKIALTNQRVAGNSIWPQLRAQVTWELVGPQYYNTDTDPLTVFDPPLGWDSVFDVASPAPPGEVMTVLRPALGNTGTATMHLRGGAVGGDSSQFILDSIDIGVRQIRDRRPDL